MRTEEPRAIHLADYQAPDFRIDTVHLDFALDPENTRVAARLAITRQRAGAPLVLHGEELKLISVTLDAKLLADGEYRLDAKTLTIASVPDRFVLETVCEIAPAANDRLVVSLFRVPGWPWLERLYGHRLVARYEVDRAGRVEPPDREDDDRPAP